MNIYKITALVLILAFTSYAVLLYSRPLPTQVTVMAHENEMKISSSAAQTRIFFSPSSIKIGNGQTKEIAVMMDTGNNAITEAQIEIKYNPSLIHVLAVRQGDAFSQPTLLLNEIDAARGRINVAVEKVRESPSATGISQLAYITVEPALTSSGSAKTQLNFMPKTVARDTERGKSLLQSTQDLSIEIGSDSPLLPR